MKPSCYIAGPMRGYPQLNFPAFFQAEKQLTKLGWKVYNPARMDREHPLKSPAYGPAECRQFAQRDLNVVTRVLHAERGDALIMLPGWKKSMGARAENAAARWVGLRRVTLRRALREGKV